MSDAMTGAIRYLVSYIPCYDPKDTGPGLVQAWARAELASSAMTDIQTSWKDPTAAGWARHKALKSLTVSYLNHRLAFMDGLDPKTAKATLQTLDAAFDAARKSGTGETFVAEDWSSLTGCLPKKMKLESAGHCAIAVE